MRKELEVRKSKLLSLVLRHRPRVFDVELDDQGWTRIDTLVEQLAVHNKPISLEELHFIVANCDKQRYSLSKDGQLIRANQGHSVPVNLAYEPVEPPSFLFHGTSSRFIPSIRKEGITKQYRHHVHLSPDETTASKVGKRHGGDLVVLVIRSKKMHEDGWKFFQTPNNVWLTDVVPIQYMRNI